MELIVMNLNFVFILFDVEGNETFEKLASMSLIANLLVYMHTQYNMDTTVSVEVFNIWIGSANFLPLVGAYLADACVGKFNILFFGNIASFLVKTCKNNHNTAIQFFGLLNQTNNYMMPNETF